MVFNRRAFSDMRRAGMGIGLSKTKLSEAMLNVLLQLPMGSLQSEGNHRRPPWFIRANGSFSRPQ